MRRETVKYYKITVLEVLCLKRCVKERHEQWSASPGKALNLLEGKG